jgi:sugar fermentation stimulation protein A
MHEGIHNVRPAAHIDAKYAELFAQAAAEGVEILAYKTAICEKQIIISQQLPVIMS